MTFHTTRQLFPAQTRTGAEAFADWRDVIRPAIDTLRRMAGTTEDEFLQIGSQLQSFYQRSTDISVMANQLVSLVSGENVVSLTLRLQRMMVDMEAYLANARSRSNESCTTLELVQELLDKLSEPLEGFQKMNKTLRMLSISTKIESARLGEKGGGFVNLAMDVEKLSHQVNDKSTDILAHRKLLAAMIAANLTGVRNAETAQDAKVVSSLKSTASSLQELVSVNERCTQFGVTVSTISVEVTGNISEVVSSMQMHDMTRQQVEHVVEALDRLLADLAGLDDASIDESRRKALIVEFGDVCELQEAQLRFASAELYSAVRTIVDNLRDVAYKQSFMANETRNVAGMADSSGSSFVDVMSQGMTSITAALTSCARADLEMSEVTKKVAHTIGEIAVFVTDIEVIGSEIELIALNAQIKAAHTGSEGAALGVLAEAIKRLSDEAVRQTDSVAATLKNINSATENLSLRAENEEEDLGGRVTSMQSEVSEILQALTDMNKELFSILADLGDRVASLTDDVDVATSGIDVHERTKVMADSVLTELERIVVEARQIVPASNEFKENLRHMEERYTMESERHIHEALARKRSGQAAVADHSESKSGADDSEFGDNFDLF